MAGAALAVAALAAALLGGCVAAPTKPAPPTEEEVDSYVRHMLDATWQSSGLDGMMERPRVKAGALEPPDEFSDSLTACYADAGFELKGWSWGADQGYLLVEETNVWVDAPAKQLAFYTCLAEHPADPVATGELLGERQLAYQYDRFVTWTIPCLRASGYSLDQVPTREEFLEAGGHLWEPYSAVQNVDGPESYALLTARCGQEMVDFTPVAAG